jgi:hypothetical protein
MARDFTVAVTSMPPTASARDWLTPCVNPESTRKESAPRERRRILEALASICDGTFLLKFRVVLPWKPVCSLRSLLRKRAEAEVVMTTHGVVLEAPTLKI